MAVQVTERKVEQGDRSFPTFACHVDLEHGTWGSEWDRKVSK